MSHVIIKQIDLTQNSIIQQLIQQIIHQKLAQVQPLFLQREPRLVCVIFQHINRQMIERFKQTVIDTKNYANYAIRQKPTN